jgi:lipoate---protein ligase
VTLAPYARDDDLIAAVQASGQPLVAVYPHPGTAVVVGRGGDPAVETRPDVIAADGVPLLRRRGGGCAVVVDPGNLVVSLALPLAGVGAITAAFTAISARIAAALAEAGVPGVHQAGVSDLAQDDRKLGGACIWRTRGLLYYSTTLLVDPAWDLIDRYLPHPPREPEYRRGREHRQFLISLAELGHPSQAAYWAPLLEPLLTAGLADLCRRIPA